ncbi:MAG: hypothetical protein GY899_02325 [Verrucomicrobiaceae bacterium]|nr:hypothetical protein [Verrucomicrobiaceae bacterium]
MSKAKNERPSEFINELPADRQLMTLRGLYDMCITMLNEKDTEIEELKEEILSLCGKEIEALEEGEKLRRFGESRKKHLSMLIEELKEEVAAADEVEEILDAEIESLKAEKEALELEVYKLSYMV